MNTFLILFACLLLAATSAYFRLSKYIWAPLLAIFLADAQYIGMMPLTLSILLWPITTLVLMVAFVPPVRKLLLTKPLFKFFQQNLPPLSETEKAAIASGTVAWEGKLFQGSLRWQELWRVPKPALTDEEQQFLNHQVDTLCRLVNDWEIVHEKADLPQEVWEYLKSEKFFGMIIPKEYGGLGFSALMHSTVITKLTSKSVSLAVTAMVPNSLGPGELLIHYGTKAQKDYYLPRLANGTEIPCFALTAPEAGSDAGSIPDQGIVCKKMVNGKEILGIRLDFDKRYITLAPVATLVGLAFKLYDPEHLIGAKTDVGITLAMIPADHAGVEIGSRHFPLRMAFMNGPIRGKNVFIPMDWIIGGVEMAGQGWRMLFECLSVGRGISLPSLSTAMGAVSYVATGAYAAVRKQFNTPIGQFEGVEESLSAIGGYAYQMEATRVFTAQTIDLGERPAVATSIAKYHMTEMARKVNNHAMDIHGGRAIMMGPANYLGAAYQAMPLNITVEGANILTRSLMIFGQGAIRCHPYLKDELLVLAEYSDDAKKALKHFDKLCTRHIGYAISNFVKTALLSLTRGKLTSVNADKQIRSYLQTINSLSASLAFIADIVMLKLGGALKRKERLSARLGDVLSHLYLSVTALKMYQDGDRSQQEQVLLAWCMQDHFYQIQEAFYGLFNNFPSRWLGFVMRVLVFPYGRIFTPPSDQLSHQVASQMLTETPIRKLFKQRCYVGDTLEDPIGLIELTFQALCEADASLQKIKKAVKQGQINHLLPLAAQCQAALKLNLLTNEEVDRISTYEKLRVRAIAVDEFPSDYPLGNEICNKTFMITPEEQSIL